VFACILFTRNLGLVGRVISAGAYLINTAAMVSTCWPGDIWSPSDE
jgi:hypothetical protein